MAQGSFVGCNLVPYFHILYESPERVMLSSTTLWLASLSPLEQERVLPITLGTDVAAPAAGEPLRLLLRHDPSFPIAWLKSQCCFCLLPNLKSGCRPNAPGMQVHADPSQLHGRQDTSSPSSCWGWNVPDNHSGLSLSAGLHFDFNG